LVFIELVVFNLLDNTRRYGKNATNVRISSEEYHTHLVIVWEDNGVGIPGEKKEKIFERGFGKNTGLGLYFIREVLALAKISIKDTGIPGEGARFEIFVPKGPFRFCNDSKNPC